MTTILILVADESIGDLLWRYVELASCLPALPLADEGAADAILRIHPSAILIDASLGVDALPLERVAAERGVPVVFVASAMSDAELRAYAVERGGAHSPLSGGARRLAETLREVLARGGPERGSLQPSLVAAAALEAHSRQIAERASAAREASRALRAEREITIAMCRENPQAMQQALQAFASSLHGDGVPAERAITVMRGAVLNALDSSGSARDSRTALEAVERCWREVWR